MRATALLVALAGCCINAVPEVEATTSSTGTSATGTTTGSGTTTSSTGGTTSGTVACSPFVTTQNRCTQDQYCNYALIPCGDGFDDNTISPATCVDICSADPESLPICGGSCSSDVDCRLDQVCTSGQCGDGPCEASSPTPFCGPGCTLVRAPHVCQACICETCHGEPILDAGPPELDGGCFGTVCGGECCGDGTFCCGSPLASPTCISNGQACPD